MLQMYRMIPFMDHVLERPARAFRAFRRPQPCSLLPVDNHSCIRQPVCIRCSATGGGNVSGVHRRQLRQAPSRVLVVEATLACCSGTTQDCTGCIHSMQCIPVSKPIHPAAGARHITRHHCQGRAFLFLSQTAKDIPSVVNER